MTRSCSEAAADPVPCRRIDRELPVQEHLRCPYCVGKRPEVESGEHDRFCDFQAGQDPISFGFPEDFGRYRHY